MGSRPVMNFLCPPPWSEKVWAIERIRLNRCARCASRRCLNDRNCLTGALGGTRACRACRRRAMHPAGLWWFRGAPGRNPPCGPWQPPNVVARRTQHRLHLVARHALQMTAPHAAIGLQVSDHRLDRLASLEGTVCAIKSRPSMAYGKARATVYTSCIGGLVRARRSPTIFHI